jgi:hypothetical protein
MGKNAFSRSECEGGPFKLSSFGLSGLPFLLCIDPDWEGFLLQISLTVTKELGSLGLFSRMGGGPEGGESLRDCLALIAAGFGCRLARFR